MKLVKATRWQKFKRWWAALTGNSSGTTKAPNLTVYAGGKRNLNYDAKSTVYNPREFRADKGPRK